MDEPSVLDYLKKKLKFWSRAHEEDGVEGAVNDLLSPDPLATASKDSIEFLVEPQTLVNASTEETPRRVPWHSLLALAFFLLGQRTFEPSPTRVGTYGLIFYAVGLFFLYLANRNQEWNLAKLPPMGSGSDDLRVKLIPLILAGILSLFAYAAFGNNQFTLLNIILWLAAFFCFLQAFWLRKVDWHDRWMRMWSVFRKESWGISVNRFHLLLILTIGVVFFFRTYNLHGVPSEPFSDHAEKILDIFDVTQGQTQIFFPRNTGREAFQMYLTVVIAKLFGTGLSFMSLKIGTVICGLATLPYLYLMGKELGGKRVAIIALFFAGIAYWPNVISRAGLRFPLYPLFVAPTLYYLIRGLRRRSRNDMILSGIALGIGLHGYSPIRILPLVVTIGVLLFILHVQSKGVRKQAATWLALLSLASFIIFLPLLRYWLENPESFSYRAFSRMGSIENPLSAPVLQVFLSNLWNGIRMFNWDDGEIWVHSVTHRPALDVISAAFFLTGVLLLIIRYFKKRHWLDLFLLFSVPLLLLPSILSLAYPGENPALNRSAGAIIPVFLIVALAVDGLWQGIRRSLPGRAGGILVVCLFLFIGSWSMVQNYDLVFNQYAVQFNNGAWNSSEMGLVIKQFGQTYGGTENAWIVPYPHWVDTRLPGVWAGIPNRDFGVWPENLEITMDSIGPKLFIVNTADETGKNRLEDLYPQGTWSRYSSQTGLEGKDFLIFFVPPDG